MHLSTKQFLVNFTGSSSYKIVDKDSWKRKQIFECFSACQNPFYSMTARSDVTKLIEVTKKKNIPSSHAILYMIGKTVNDIPEFKCRLKDGNVVKYDKISLGMTVDREDDLFYFLDLEYFENSKEFLNNASNEIEPAKKSTQLFPDEEPREDVVYLSCIPWVNFTAFTNPISDYKTDTIPRIVWGKYTKEGDKTTIPVSLEAHHGFIDGRHMGLFYQKLQENFDNADKIFKDIDKTDNGKH